MQSLIRNVVKENRKSKMDDFTDKVDDTNFLNQLQAGVSRWIREIATVSFDSDTGLKEAIETAKDYNNLMKDFPLNELLHKTSKAIQSIFNH